MSRPIISVEGLGKCYRVGHQSAKREHYTALRDILARNTKELFRKTRDLVSGRQIIQGDVVEDFWALKDVSFDVEPGEVVGIIGRNGAGKSTLLKILSRITEPTEGRVTLRGRVASLLEVGTGFHPELSGRENIFLNGAILGMTRNEIKRKFDEIVDFAEVEKFLDTPVKRYSSGMYVRLAFAVAAHLEPEILIVDEVLAVGDAEFQKKCLGKMGEVAKGGRTVLFVSHNLAAVQALCSKAVLLLAGKVQRVGDVDSLVADYTKTSREHGAITQASPFLLDSELEIRTFQFCPIPVASGSAVQFRVELGSRSIVPLYELAILIYSQTGVRVAILDLRGKGVPCNIDAGENFELSGEIKSLPLVEGNYSVGLYLSSGSISGNFLDLAHLSVSQNSNNNSSLTYAAPHRGYVELNIEN